MNYPLYIEASEETLRMLDEKFKPVAEDRFIYSLQQKHWTIEDCRNFNVRELLGKTTIADIKKWRGDNLLPNPSIKRMNVVKNVA